MVKEGPSSNKRSEFVATKKKSKADVEKRSELRRVKRQEQKRREKVCFNCRQPGHDFNSCPAAHSSNMVVGVCFKCGSSEHKSSGCKLKTKSFPFAKCFVCGQIGHLSRDCAENPNGLFPDGGACLLCGNKNHLKSDCPTLQKNVEETEVTVAKNDAKLQGCVDYEPEAKPSKKEGDRRKKKKVVF